MYGCGYPVYPIYQQANNNEGSNSWLGILIVIIIIIFLFSGNGWNNR